MGRLVAVCTLFLGICLAALPAGAAQRVALVVGNSDYKLIPALSNPANDAALMAETLRAVGFEVIEAKNADRRSMARAIRDFGKRLRRAGPQAVGLFYYAGHGVQAAGTNYLIPLGAPVADEADLEIEAVSASWVLGQMESAGNALNIVILDACRNNPFKGAFRAATRGLARMNAPSGSLVAYAAAPGQVAADGTADNSPYTAALAAAMREPGLVLEQVFKRVRVAVEAATGEQQTPWEESSLKGDFYFVPQGSTVTVTPPGAPLAQPQPAFDARALDLAFWNSIEKSADPADFEDYLVRYPDGAFSGLAKRRLAARLSERKPAEDQVAVGVFPSAGRQPGETFKDCPECPEMVVIPPGRFRMGDLSGGGDDDEKPVHAVTIGYKFAVGKYEVTFAQWHACVADGGCGGHRPDGEGWGRGRRPVIHVSWDDAKAYVRWLSGKSGQAYRLLSEAEWEYAARAGTTTAYNTGSNISKGQARYRSGRTVRVGFYAPNAFGLHDVHGNVWEWVEDCWNGRYSGAPVDGSAWLRGDCGLPVVRGGSWGGYRWSIRSAYRGRNATDYRSRSFGFRVARTL